MNVAIFTDNDFDKVNGVTTTFTAVLRSAPRGMRLRVFTAGRADVDAPDYLAVRSVAVPIPFYPGMPLYLPRPGVFLRRARAERIDLVHVATPGPVGLAGLFVASRLRLPVVGSFHTDLAAYARLLSGSPRLGALMRAYLRWPYARCARVLVPSEHTRYLLLEASADPATLDVWPRGVDATLFTPARRSPALRAAWQVSARQPALLYVGRISREKGLLLLPAVADRLRRLGVAHRFVFVGDGPLLPELRAAMPEALFTGTLSREQVASAFASADLFVFPSQTDTAGNVVLEAQASGLPLVVTGTGGPRENMIADRTGRVCHHQDPDEWAAAIAGALAEPARGAMARAAREYAMTRTWDRALEPLYRAYREVYEAAAAAAAPPAAPLPATIEVR